MLKDILARLSGSISLPADIPGDWAACLEQAFAPLAQSKIQNGAALARDAVRFVLTGDPVAVLVALAADRDVAGELNISTRRARYGGEKPPVYGALAAVPVPVALRLARALAAAADFTHGGPRLRLPQGFEWVEVMLMHASGQGLAGWSNSQGDKIPLTWELLERLIVAAGGDARSLVTAALTVDKQNQYGGDHRQLLLRSLPDFAGALERHADSLRPLLQPESVRERVHVLTMLQPASNETLEHFADELSQLAVVGSKQVRVTAESLALRIPRSVISPLRGIAKSGKPEQRLNALRLLEVLSRRMEDAALAREVREVARGDAAPSVVALAAEWDSAATITDDASRLPDVAAPEIDWAPLLTADQRAAIEKAWKLTTQEIERSNEQSRKHNEAMRAQGHNYPLRQTKVPAASVMQELFACLESRSPGGIRRDGNIDAAWHYSRQLGPMFAALPGATAVQLARLLHFFGALTDGDGQLTMGAAHAFNVMNRKAGRPSLLELATTAEGFGVHPQTLIRNYCYGYGSVLAQDWPDDQVWPYFAAQLEELARAFTDPSTRSYSFNRSRLFRAVASFPTTPPILVQALFATALGTTKTDRLGAQEALANHVGKEARIISALADGKSETRIVAAEWLGRLCHLPAIPALERALAKEKHDVAKSAMLTALQGLGRPVGNYVDRKSLLAEAVNSNAKGLPRDIEWFPFAALPVVRWSDTQEIVPADLLRWMLVQATRQKSPEPNALLRTYCAMFEPRDREQFGQFVLENWLREDERPISAEEASARATTQAQQTHAIMRQYPQAFQNDPKLGMSIEEIAAAYLPAMLKQPAGSAIGSKGLLAIAAACAAGRVVGPVARYLKEWYGSRAAQGKALIAMLAWIDHPAAIQLMLSIGNRFRTRSFQEEATRQAEALAERKGWTLAELADRTIPTGGFDETGVLELGYGARSFTARLLDDFKVELFNPDGKKIASLPEPRQDDDAERAKDSKKAFSAAKKELKNIVTLQSDRLYEALCTERDWSADDWSRYLNQHAIMRKLVQRLVWIEVTARGERRAFRPLDDGTLTDIDDSAVSLGADSRVRVAHDSLLVESDVARWQDHLRDYEINPLFQQFGKGTYTLPADMTDATEIGQFTGHLIEAFALRGRASKLGYSRGATQDGGWFFHYEKRFPTLGLQANIEFTGNGLPEENRTVALKSLSFSSTAGGNAWEQASLPVGKVPRILLSECYNDLRLIAADGPGFDPDWQKKTEY